MIESACIIINKNKYKQICVVKRIPYSGLISRGEIFANWIVKTFRGSYFQGFWIITKYTSKMPFHQINSITIPS